MSSGSIQESAPCQSKTGRVIRKTGKPSVNPSVKERAIAAKAVPPIPNAAPAIENPIPLPEVESFSRSPTLTTNPETVTPTISGPCASAAISPMTPSTTPIPDEKAGLLNNGFSTEFSLAASYCQEYPYGTESLYKECISEVMLKDGWSIKKEVRTEFGIADLVAQRGTETWVIEAKISSDNNSIAHACGQLLFYTAAIPFTKRVVATPNRLPSFSLYKAMRLNGIEPFEFTEYYFSAKCLFDEKSLLKRHANMIESATISIQELMLFLSNADPIHDPDVINQWRALAAMHRDAAHGIDAVFGKPHLELAA